MEKPTASELATHLLDYKLGGVIKRLSKTTQENAVRTLMREVLETYEQTSTAMYHPECIEFRGRGSTHFVRDAPQMLFAAIRECELMTDEYTRDRLLEVAKGLLDLSEMTD